jgi:hypothetical protein
MEMSIQIGKYYTFTRTNGKVIKGKLIQWTNKDSYFLIEEKTSVSGFSGLSEDEFKTLKEVDPRDIQN